MELPTSMAVNDLLVQMVSVTSQGASLGEDNGASHKKFLPNETLAGNCLVLFLTYTYAVGRSGSVSDSFNGNWGRPVLSGSDSGTQIGTSVFVLPNASPIVRTSGKIEIDVEYGASFRIERCLALELSGLAASSVVGASAQSTATISGGALTSMPSITTPDNDANGGHLILTFGMDCTAQQSAHSVTSFSPSGSATLVDADFTWDTENNVHSFLMGELQATHGSYTPGASITMSANDSFLVSTIALKLDPSKGVPRPSDFRIVKLLLRTRTSTTPTSVKIQCPNIGNCLLLSPSVGNSFYNITSISDSVGDSADGWVQPTSASPGNPAWWRIYNIGASSTRELTMTIGTPRGDPESFAVFDVQNALTSSDPVTVIKSQDTLNFNNATVSDNQPAGLIPDYQKGGVFARHALGNGPGLGFDYTAGMPSAATWLLPTYSGETDNAQTTNADNLAWIQIDNSNPNGGGLRRLGRTDNGGVYDFNWAITARNPNSGNAFAIFVAASGALRSNFPIIASTNNGTSPTDVSRVFDVSQACTLYALRSAHGNGGAVWPMTINWVGGTPAGATAWTLINESHVSTATDVAGAIWKSVVSSPLTGVRVAVTSSANPTASANSSLLYLDAFTNAASNDGHRPTRAGSAATAKNLTAFDILSGSIVLFIESGDGAVAGTPTASSKEVFSVVSDAGNQCGAVVNEALQAGSGTVGYTGTQTVYETSAVVVRPSNAVLPREEWLNRGVENMGATTSLALAYPTVIVPTSGSKLLAFVASKGNNPPSTPTDFTLLTQVTEVATAAAGADSGSIKNSVYERNLTGSISGSATFTKTTETGQFMGGFLMELWQNGLGWQATVASSGTNNVVGTAISVVSVSNVDVQTNDLVVVSYSDISDVGSAYTEDALTGSGLTLQLLGAYFDVATTTGNDGRLHVAIFRCTSGSGTVALTWTATASGTAGASHKGAGSFIRIRATPETGIVFSIYRMAPLLAR